MIHRKRPQHSKNGVAAFFIMKIECFLSESCGSYHQLRQHIEQALSELNTEAEVSYPLVYYDEALRIGMKGSPAIRINGKDFDKGGSPGVA